MGPSSSEQPHSGRYHDDAASTTSEDTVTPAQSPTNAGPPSDEDGLLTSSRKPRIAQFVPVPVRRVWKAVVRWVKGPRPPRPYRIEPFFPQIQTAPIRLLDRYVPKRRHRILLLVVFYFFWLLSFASVLHKSAFASDVPGYGSPTRIGCGSRYW